MRSHFKNENRQGQNRSKDDVLFQLKRFRIALVRLRFLLGIAACLFKRTRFIARGFNRLDKITKRHLASQFDMSAFGREINAGAGYAWHGIQCLFNLAHTGGAAHAFNGEIGTS